MSFFVLPTSMALLVLLISSSSSSLSSAASRPAVPFTDNDRNQELLVATQEMQRANYFTFVMLINMAPPGLFIEGNLTFLMPTDKTLSRNMITPQTSVVDFLLRHSIPSPLLFQDLQHFPTGSFIPTSKPELVLRITNNGKRRFFLNNVRIRSPDICTSGSSIRCHGIDEVVQASRLPNFNTTPPADQCRNASSPPPCCSRDGATPNGFMNPSPSTAPPPNGQQSGSHQMCYFGISEFVTACVMLLVVMVKLSA